MNSRIRDDPTREEWEGALESLGEGDYRQTWEYAEASIESRKANGVLRLTASGHGEALAIMQGLIRGSRIGCELLSGGSSGGGPIISEQASGGLAREIIRSLVGHGRRQMCERIRLHIFDDKGLGPVLEELGFRRVRPADIFFVDLNRDPEAIWVDFEGAKRRNVRKAEKLGVRVEISQEPEDADQFYRMYLSFAEKRQFEPMPHREVETLWRWLKPVDRIRVFTAKKGDEAVASALVINHLDALFCPYTCSNEAGRETRANDILHWRIIRWGAERKMYRYNMGEVYTDPESEQHGVYRWKRGFSGYTAKMSIYEKVINRWFHGFKRVAKRVL